MSAEAHVRLANEYLQRDRLREAADEFREAIELEPRNVTAVLGLSQVAAGLNDTASALALAQRAAELKPKDPEVLNRLAAVLRQAGQMDEAAKTFERALALRPKDPTILLQAAQCWAEAEEWKRAEACCRRAVEADPRALAPRLMLGNLYWQQNWPTQAVAEWERLDQEFPNSAVVHEALGRARQAQGRLQGALAEFTQAQRLSPQWLDPYLNAGDTCLRLKSYPRAVQHFEKALQLSPRSPAARLGLVQAHIAQGKPDQAIEVYEKMLEDDPDHPIALNDLAYLYAEKGEHLDQALGLARRAVEATPEDGTTRDTLGWVCYRAGRTPEALTHLWEAVRLRPERGRYHYHLGQALLSAGRRREAAESFRTALSRGLAPEEKKDAEAALRHLHDL